MLHDVKNKKKRFPSCCCCHAAHRMSVKEKRKRKLLTSHRPIDRNEEQSDSLTPLLTKGSVYPSINTPVGPVRPGFSPPPGVDRCGAGFSRQHAPCLQSDASSRL